MKKQFIHKACWGGNKGSFWVLNLGYMFHIALRLLFISLQTPQELFQTELSALFVPVSDLQRAHGWEQVPSGEVAVAFPLQSCFWTSEQESTLPALCSSTLCSPQFWQVAHEGAPRGGDGFRLRPKHRIKSPDPFCVYSFSTEILILETCNLDHITQESFSIHSSPTWGSFSKPIPMSELKKAGCSAAKKSVPLGHLEWLPLLSVHCQTKGWCLHFLPFPNPPPCQSSG